MLMQASPVGAASPTSSPRYAPLPDNQSIRMLVLYPGYPGDPLKCTLEFVNINSPGLYEALSYVWGDPEREYAIDCDGAKHKLTKSLYDALQRLRLPKKSRRLWADQICINQQSLEERSQQVQFMNSIYWNATHVLVWLGIDTQSVANIAFKLVHGLAEKFGNEKKHAQFRAEHTDRLERLSKDTWIPLRRMTELPWFARGWIVQEIGTKTPATILWGENEIDWKILHRVCEDLTEYHLLRKQLNIGTAKIKYVFQRFIEPERTSRHANRFSFIYELHRARHLQVTDARDRVFAMLGHYSVRHGPNSVLKALRADYTKTVEQVYVNVAVRALTGDQESLITLAAVQHLTLPSPEKGDNVSEESTSPIGTYLPTWTPDWRTYQSHILSEPTSPHHCSGDTPPNLQVDPSSRILSIRGVMVDQIDACSEGLRDKEFHIDTSGRNLAIERLWREVCGQNTFDLSVPYINDDSAVFAYTQTLSNACVAISWQEGSRYDEVAQEEWLSHGAAYLHQAVVDNVAVSENLRKLAAVQGPGKWSRAANGASSNRAFARTSKGYYVLGPKVMQVGDIVCVLFGGKMPFCLRPWGRKYLLVGECYVHGLMKGEAMSLRNRGDLVESTFEIV